MKITPLFFFVLVMLPLYGQTPVAVVSPEVHPDRSVTFSVFAPKASVVTLTADWQWKTDPLNFQKAENGVWSLTVGPLPPAIYIYSFTVDGMAMADPANPRIKLRDRGSASLVEIPSDPPALWQEGDVPHGNVETIWHKSTVLNGETRTMVVYTPPGYAQEPNRRYPVLYLLHGSNDTQFGWTAVGQVNFVLDNLLAETKAVPMIIVMPFGYAINPYVRSARPAGYPPGNNTSLFEKYLMEDVIPTIDARYRTLANREHRSIGGMSMGAEQALGIFFDHLDQFSSVGAFCPNGLSGLETRYPSLLDDPKSTNAKISVLWLGCGRQDNNFPGSQRVDEILTAHQINHIWQPSDAVHNYALWQQHIAEFLPLIFHEVKSIPPPSTVSTREIGPPSKGG